MRRRSDIVFAASALAVFAALGPAEAKDEIQELYGKLQSYRGVYELRQVARAAGAAPATISGRMTIEARVGCKDYEMATTITMRVASAGRAVEFETELKTQETLDGRTYRTSMRMMQGGRDAGRHEAEAVLQTRDGPGRGVVKRGAPETLKLEAGTVLPGTHTLRTLAAVAAGRTEVKHRVYIGEDDVRLADISSTVLGVGTAPANPALGDAAGKPGRKWRDEYVAVGARSEPRVTETFSTNEGVMISVVYTVQGLRIASTATKIEILPKPSCR